MADRTGQWNGWDGTTAGEYTPGEWSALYAQYLVRAASQSTKTSTSYQQAMDAIARGELAPTVFQDRAAAFIQARGPAYTSKLAELSSRFLGRLVALDAGAAHELASLLLAEETALPATPPELDPSDPIRWYQQLTDYAKELSATTISAYQRLFERVAAGEVAPSTIQTASTHYIERHLPQQLNRLGGLYFELLNGLNDLRVASEEDFLEEVLATAKKPGQEAPPALNLVAPVGGTTATSLVLSNTRREPARIHCSVTDVRRADGVGPAFSPKTTVAPPTLEIPPGGQGTLVLSLQLDEDTYTAGALYVGAVHIEREGEPRLEMPLRITATPAAPNEEPVPPRKAPKPAAGKRRSSKRTRSQNKP